MVTFKNNNSNRRNNLEDQKDLTEITMIEVINNGFSSSENFQRKPLPEMLIVFLN